MERQSLGDYVLIKKIGEGSLGAVFLARHRFTEQQFVVKILPEELSQDLGFIQRFQEEIKALAKLDHPNLVKVHNVSFAEGIYFLVTDCIVDNVGENSNLAHYLASQRAPLSEEKIHSILFQVADALDYIHSRGSEEEPLSHGNLKLNNVLIGKNDGESVQIFLSDCGLAKIVGMGTILSRLYHILAESLGIVPLLFPNQQFIQGGYSTKLGDNQKLSTLHASFLQTYSFLAPENKRPMSAHMTPPRGDQYAFGVLAYYLLTSTFPEGVFELPCEKSGFSQYNWNNLVIHCLQMHSEKRPSHLTSFLNEKLFLQKDAVTKMQSPLGESPFSEEKESILAEKQAVENYSPKKNLKNSAEPLLTEMASIPEGQCYRGSNDGNRDERPRHLIFFRPFAMDIHPVTNEQFIRFLEIMDGEKDSNNNDMIRLRDSRIKRKAGRLMIEPGYAKHPVVGVSWYGAMAYAKWVGKRLPTEIEWEVAARANIDESLYPTGDTIEKSQANFFSLDTTAVMSYSANDFSLYDMVGNVYEWCQDWYDHRYYDVSMQEPYNPQGPIQGVYRVLRGGCWKSLKEDLRCSHRHRNKPGTMNSTYGFRCASDL